MSPRLDRSPPEEYVARMDGGPLPDRPGRVWAALAVVVLLGLLSAAGPAPPRASAAANDLAGQWHFDEILDPNNLRRTPDSSGNGLAGFVSPEPGVTQTTGRFASAFAFDAAAPGYVRVPPSALLEPATVTVLAWVRRAGTPGPGAYLVAKGAQDCQRSSYALDTGPGGGLRFSVSSGAGLSASPAAGPGVWDGQWHAVAGTFDGRTVRLYLDGRQIGGGTPAGAPIGYGTDDDAFEVGSFPVSSCSQAYQGGAIDEVRVYRRALSATEVGRLQTATGAVPPVLVPDAPGGPGPSPPPPPPPSPPSVPKVTSVTAATEVVAGRPALLRAQVTGRAQRLEWDVTGDGKADMGCSGSRTTLQFRPPRNAGRRASATRFTGRVTVRAVGAGGSGAASTTLAVRPAQRIAGPARLVRRVSAAVRRDAAVYACGKAADLPTAKRELSARADPDRYCLSRTVSAGSLEVEGCFKSIHELKDVPASERDIVSRLMLAQHFSAGGTGVARAAGVAFSLQDAWIARGAIRVNGVDVAARDGAKLIFYPQADTIAASKAEVRVGGIALKLPEEDYFSLDTQPGAGGRIPLDPLPRLPGPVKALGGFAMAGDLRVTLVPAAPGKPAGSEITTNLELPSFFNLAGQGDARARVTLRVTSDGELVLDDMHLQLPDVWLGALEVKSLRLDYGQEGTDRVWRGQAALCVVATACLDASEHAGQTPPGGIVIRNNRLDRAFVNLEFPDPGIALYPNVYLHSVGAGAGLNPTRLFGNVVVRAIGIYEIDGRVLMAFPSAATPLTLRADEIGGLTDQDYGHAYSRFLLAASGTASLRIPALETRLRLGGAYLVYEAPGYVHVGGDVEETFAGIIRLRGRTSGQFNVANGRFNFGQDIEACVLDYFCRGAATRLSSNGVGACAVFRFAGESIGIGGGVRFDPFDVYLWPLDGCKWSTFEDASVLTRRGARADGPLQVRIRRGDPSRAIRLDGAGGAPRLRVTGPDGTTLDGPAGAGTRLTPRIRILRSERARTTVVGLQDPAPGTYTIATLPGSPAIAKVTTADDPRDARVKVRLRGHGLRRTLFYDVRRRPAQRVTFMDAGPGGARPIGTVTGGRGKLRFSVAPGGGRRHIEAQFELGGVGAETKRLATFRAPSARLGRPKRLSVGRRSKRLRVAWRRVPGARRYEVLLTLNTGGQRVRRARRPAVALRQVPRASRGRVTVRAIAPLRQGRAASRRFRAVARRRTPRFEPAPRVKRRHKDKEPRRTEVRRGP